MPAAAPRSPAPSPPPSSRSSEPSAPSPSTRRRLLVAGCGALVAALLAVAALAPLPFAVTYPGMTADVLGERDGVPVISVTGAEVGRPSGELRLTTINATAPDAVVRLGDVV